MRGPRPEPLFLARETYRRRRMMDAARFLPFAAAFLFLVPVLWAGDAGTATGMAYLFGIWIAFILVAFGISRALPGLPADGPANDGPANDGPANDGPADGERPDGSGDAAGDGEAS